MCANAHLSIFILCSGEHKNNRLREERQRLKLNQDEFAEIGGVKRRAQITYESGERCPDGHYFSAIAAVGADVQYILTGMRSNYVVEQNPGYTLLNREEAALLDNFRHIEDKEDQRAIKKMALLAAQAAKHEKKSETAWDGIDRRKKGNG